jgi:hypothetical protein
VSGIISKPSKPKLPPPPEPIEKITTIEEDADDAQRREKKKLLRGGRQSTILSGITASLKKRLGE